MSENISKLSHILKNQTPLLFLGAGFASGATRKDGSPIPLGSGLKELLIHDILQIPKGSKDYTDLHSLSLSKVSQFISIERGEAVLSDYLVSIYKNVIPADYHYYLNKYDWSRIYTTNIDDIIETVYKKRNLVVINTNRPSTLKTQNSVEYIKLHGDVNNPSAGLIFSSEDYINSVQDKTDYRFRILTEDFHYKTIIFVGTSFDEINIDYYLRLYENAGHKSAKGNLVFITPCPDIFFKTKIKKYGGILIEWTAEKFINHLKNKSHYLPTDEFNKKKLESSGFEIVNSIKSKINVEKGYHSRIYFGYEPDWKDIISDWDFKHDEISKIINLVIERDFNIGYFAIYGKALSGKTCALLRIAIELVNKGFCVIKFTGSELNLREFSNFINHDSSYDNYALIVDNGGFHYMRLRQLVKQIPSDKKLAVITATRPFYHAKKRYYLSDYFRYEQYWDTKISRNFAIDIVEKLNNKGYIGYLKTLEKQKQVDYFENRNDLISALFDITFGKGYRNRLCEELSQYIKSNNSDFDILLDLCIFNLCELPYYPKNMITTFYNKNINDTESTFQNFIKLDKYENLSLRTSFLLKNIISKINKKSIIKNIKEILIQISPQIIEGKHNYSANIFESLIKVKFIVKSSYKYNLKINYDDMKNLLYEIKNYYNENSYYWLQLGLAEQACFDFEQALNHFRQAEALKPNSYMIQHAIGRNFLKHANNTPSFYDSNILFQEGEKILLELIKYKEEQQVKYYSIHCFINEKIDFYKKFNISPKVNEIKILVSLFNKLNLNDSNDAMSIHIRNKFYKYLQSIGKSQLIKINLYDLSKFSHIHSDDEDIEDIFESIEGDFDFQ